MEADVEHGEVHLCDPRGPSKMITCDHYLDVEEAESLIEDLEAAIEQITKNSETGDNQ